MTIREKMKRGMLYIDVGDGLEEERKRCKEFFLLKSNSLAYATRCI